MVGHVDAEDSMGPEGVGVVGREEVGGSLGPDGEGVGMVGGADACRAGRTGM